MHLYEAVPSTLASAMALAIAMAVVGALAFVGLLLRSKLEVLQY